MADSNSGMTAVVAIVAIIAILVIGYFAVRMFAGTTPPGNGINVHLDTTSGGAGQ